VIHLSVENNRTSMIGADPYILSVLDRELRYPTPIAAANEAGVVLPGVNGDWDGWARLLHTPKTIPPWFATGLLPEVMRHLAKHNYQAQVSDARERPDLDVPEAAVKIPLWDYQEEAVARVFTQMGVLDGRGVLDMPPRSGKTRTMCEIIRRLGLPTIWIAPTDRIVTQTQEVLEGWFGSNYSMHLVGAVQDNVAQAAHRRIVVCTAATAGRLPAEFYQSRKCVVVDEWHHAAAATYKTIFGHCDHIYYRYGMTGTFFRSGDDALAMYALLSNTIYKITSEDLLRRGRLVPSYVVFVPVPGPKLRGVGNTFQSGHGTHGIHEHKLRQQLVAHAAMLLWRTGRKVLVLVGTKRQGHMLRKILLALLPRTPGAQFQSCEFVSTDMIRKKQGEILKSFETSNEVKVLIGTSILGEGVDLPGADALVYAKGEKAEVTLTQNVYRTCTASPGKSEAVIVDFADRHHRRLLRHSHERLRVYFNEPTFSVSVLDDPRQFPGWLEHLPPGGQHVSES
jgi:superfamily II DNA or RNA helicase